MGTHLGLGNSLDNVEHHTVEGRLELPVFGVGPFPGRGRARRLSMPGGIDTRDVDIIEADMCDLLAFSLCRGVVFGEGLHGSSLCCVSSGNIEG